MADDWLLLCRGDWAVDIVDNARVVLAFFSTTSMTVRDLWSTTAVPCGG